MHPVDEYAFLKHEIRRLEDRAKALRLGFLNGGPLRGEAHEVYINRPTRRVFLREKLPHYILNEPSLWEVRESPVVTVRYVGEPLRTVLAV